MSSLSTLPTASEHVLYEIFMGELATVAAELAFSQAVE